MRASNSEMPYSFKTNSVLFHNDP